VPIEECESGIPRNTSRMPCQAEFEVTDSNGEDIEIGIECSMYEKFERSGGNFQKEMEKKIMTKDEFRNHFGEKAGLFMDHHFRSVMNAQSRRKLYSSAGKVIDLKNAVIAAGDFSAVKDGHSQYQLNQTIQLHSGQLVILVSYLIDNILTTKAYSFWFQLGTSKLKTDGHMYRQCMTRVIENLKEKGIPIDRLYLITDGAPTQFKNRYMVYFLSILVRKFGLLFVMIIWPPTATFKGEHDGVGALDKVEIDRAEKNETDRFPTTRRMMPFLWNIVDMSPTPLTDPNRLLHAIDQHLRVFVVEESQMEQQDKEDSRIIVTNKAEEDYNCSTSDGIFTSHNAIVFADTNSDLKAPITYYLRRNFCACNNCLKALSPEDYLRCTYMEDFGPLLGGTMTHKVLPPEPTVDVKIREYIDFLSREGLLIDGERIIVRVRGGGLALLTSLPEVLERNCSKRKNNVVTTYKRGDVLATVDMLMRVPPQYIRKNPIPDGHYDYIKNVEGKAKNITLHFNELILPPLPPIEDTLTRGMLTPYEILEEKILKKFIIRINAQNFESLLD
jgi:hypothetical protein